MYRKLGAGSILLVITGLVAGCATNRSEIQLTLPAEAIKATETVPVAGEGGSVIVLRTVQDLRVFAESPSDPSTPSLGFGGAGQAPAEIKARAFGRKRNGFGMALGDMLLPEGQTVEGVVRKNVHDALVEAGFKVIDTPTGSLGEKVLDVRILQFWAWMKPGFWALTTNANIETDLVLAGTTATHTLIKVHAEDSRQMATEGAWQEIALKALGVFRAQIKDKSSAFR